jgi:hypothetical protein
MSFELMESMRIGCREGAQVNGVEDGPGEERFFNW